MRCSLTGSQSPSVKNCNRKRPIWVILVIMPTLPIHKIIHLPTRSFSPPGLIVPIYAAGVPHRLSTRRCDQIEYEKHIRTNFHYHFGPTFYLFPRLTHPPPFRATLWKSHNYLLTFIFEILSIFSIPFPISPIILESEISRVL